MGRFTGGYGEIYGGLWGIVSKRTKKASNWHTSGGYCMQANVQDKLVEFSIDVL